MYSCGPLHMAEKRQADQFEPTYSSSVPIWDVALKTCLKQWMRGRGGERGSGISVLMAWHDDDDDIYIYIYIYIYTQIYIWKFVFFVDLKREKVNILKWIGPQRDLYSFKNYLFSSYTGFQDFAFFRELLKIFLVWCLVYIVVTILMGWLFLLKIF